MPGVTFYLFWLHIVWLESMAKNKQTNNPVFVLLTEFPRFWRHNLATWKSHTD